MQDGQEPGNDPRVALGADTRSALEAELRSLSELHGAAMRLIEAPDEQSVHELVLASIVALLQAPLAKFYARDGTSDRFRLAAWHGMTPELGELWAVTVPESDSATARAIAARGYIAIPDAAGERAVHAVPLTTLGGELVGVATFHFPTPRPEVAHERRLIDQHVRQASATIGRMRAERALEQNEESFRHLVQNIRDYAFYMLDPAGRVATWNIGAQRLTGWSAGEIVGQHFRCFYQSADQARRLPEQELAIAESQGRYEGEGYRLKKDGSRFWGDEVVSAMRAKDGTLLGFAKISRDLTERKQFQDALRKSEQRHRLILENIRDYAIFMVDGEGRIASWSPGAEHVFGYAESEIIGQSDALLFTEEDRERDVHRNELVAAARTGRVHDERWQLRKDGARFWASGVMSPLRRDDGALLGFVKVYQDLSEIRRASEQRQRLFEREQVARREAERAVTVRDGFLAVVSHELRTPLAAILLWARLLRSGAVREDQRQMALQAIEQSAAAQQNLIEDLLDMGRTMTGKMQLALREVDPTVIVNAAIDAVRPMADAKGIHVHAELGPTRLVRADPQRLQQVLWNVIQNAVKFSERNARVDVLLRQEGESIVIDVVDTGRGVSPEFLPHIFEMFRQADSSTTRSQGGLGLGLAIARHLVELHGGTMLAVSGGIGKGATFTVSLPLGEANQRAQGAAGGTLMASEKVFEISERLAGLRVLVVEDDANTRTALTRVLSASAASVEAAESAADGLATYLRGIGNARFQALVVDLAMPHRDGFQLMRDVRDLEDERRIAPATLVALTGYALEDAREQAHAAGANVHLVKPVDPMTLVETLEALKAS